MVDTTDRLGVSGFSIDCVSHFYVYAANLASFILGAGNELGYFWPHVVLASGDLQILYLAFGFAGALDDAVGTPVAKATDRGIKHP